MDESMLIGKFILAYLLGSIPSGLLIGKLCFHTDVRQFGSKNIGATNTYRVLGWRAALPVFFCDAIKGSIGVWLMMGTSPLYMILGGIMAMIGHNWSIFLKGKGGRGVATGLGVIIALSPAVAGIAFVIWGILVLLFKFVSLGSIVATASIPILMYAFDEPVEYIIFGAIAAIFVIFRHRENIVRLLQGKELKVERVKRGE